MEYKAYALMAILLASVASVGTLGIAYAQTGFTIELDNTQYSTGDTITISGNVGTIQAGQPVLIWVTSPAGAAARSDQVSVAADGSYTYSFPAGGPLMKDSGTYNVRVTYAGVNQNKTFDFTATGGATGGWKTATLLIDGKDKHNVQYQITSGSLKSLTGDSSTSTITATINATSAGQLKLQLPRNIADAKDTNGKDLDYIVFVDEVETTPNDDFGNSTRTLTIDFEANSETVDIVGTFLVPEFGAIAAIVLAVAIVGIIVATTKYSKFSFLPKM